MSEKSAEKSPKNRFSVGLKKKNAWKIRLPEKSAENRLYRQFFSEKIGTGRKIGGKIGCGRHALGGELAAGEVGEKSARIRIYHRFIGDISVVLSAESRPLRFDPCFDPTVQICSVFFFKIQRLYL